MPITPNRTLLEKADIALSSLTSAGLLEPEQAMKFIRLLIKQSKLMGMSTVPPMKSFKKQIDKIRFGSRVLRAGVEAQALSSGDRATPDFSRVELDVKLFKGEVRITDETLEDNIETGELRNTIMSLLGETVARDMEEVALEGDTTSGDAFLAKFDGLLKQATSNVVDAGVTTLTKSILKDCMKTLPSEFLRDKSAMRFLTSTGAEIDYRDSLADRGTALGDKQIETNTTVGYNGIPVIDLQMMPEDLGVANDCTNLLFMDPKNVHFGIYRDIRLETDREISEGVFKIVCTLRFDVKFAEETAVVKATNVQVSLLGDL